MTQIVQGLFGGGSADKKAQQEAQRQRELQQIAQDRAAQSARDASDKTSGAVAAAKVVRGRRLLNSQESGGLATTLGG